MKKNGPPPDTAGVVSRMTTQKKFGRMQSTPKKTSVPKRKPRGR